MLQYSWYNIVLTIKVHNLRIIGAYTPSKHDTQELGNCTIGKKTSIIRQGV